MKLRHSSLARWLPVLGLWLGCTTVSDDNRTWGVSERLDEENGVNALFGAAIDDDGDALVVWSASDVVFASHTRAGSAAGPNERIDSRGFLNFWPDVAMSPEGDAVAVWVRETSFQRADYSVWSNRYARGVGWETAVQIDNGGPGGAFGHHVAVDPDGNAVAVWRQLDGTHESIWANRSTLDDGWGAAELIEFDNRGHAADPRVAVDVSGDAIAVWQQSDGARTHIFGNRYTAGGNWGVPRLLSNEMGDARLADVTMDANGNALAVWQQRDDGRNDIWATQFTRGGGWGDAQLIEDNDEGDATEARVGSDVEGRAVAVWKQFDGNTVGIWANRYLPGAGWGRAERISTNDSGDALRPRVAVSPSGTAIAVWLQSDGFDYDAWSSTHAPGRDWGSPERVDPLDQGLGQPVRIEVAIDSEGNGVAAWLRRDPGLYSAAPYQPSQLWMARLE